MRGFKVGDRIRYIGVDKDYSGKCGTIIAIENDSIPYGVKFDEKVIGGHDLDRKCECGYGRWLELEEIELIKPTLEDYTIQELEEELKRRKDTERKEIIEELKKYLVNPRHQHSIPVPKHNCELTMLEFQFKDYCEGKTTEELKDELKRRKDCQVNCLVTSLNNIINDLRDLGYTIPYEDGTVIDSLELNKALDSIGVFYE